MMKTAYKINKEGKIKINLKARAHTHTYTHKINTQAHTQTNKNKPIKNFKKSTATKQKQAKQTSKGE